MTNDNRRPTEPARRSATEVRQGEIILRTRWRRIIFIAGLVGIVVLPLLASVFGYL